MRGEEMIEVAVRRTLLNLESNIY